MIEEFAGSDEFLLPAMEIGKRDQRRKFFVHEIHSTGASQAVSGRCSGRSIDVLLIIAVFWPGLFIWNP